MTGLFLRFYAGVLVVLFLAWLIHSWVLDSRSEAEFARVVLEAHAGGARLVASQLELAPAPKTDVPESIREKFAYPIEIVAASDLPQATRKRLDGASDVCYENVAGGHYVVARLSDRERVVRLGPFPNYDLLEIEESLGGWMRLAGQTLAEKADADRIQTLQAMQPQFEIPLAILPRNELTEWPRSRLASGSDVVFYSTGNNVWFAATPLDSGNEVLQVGPFPNFEKIEQKAATTTLALVLLPAAFAIALLLRPVARQLRRVEHAAQAIAAGDLSVRVDEDRVRSAKSLAQAFNHMASRTETMVRTQRELMQAVSHELRTPLARMRFAIDLIEEAKDDAERKQRLDSLDAAAEELNDLVGELLMYVRMETAEPKLTLEPVSLLETVRDLIPKHSEWHPSLEIECVSELSATDTVIVADQTAIQRVVGNLLSNAGRFARSRVRLQITAEGRWLTLDVDDDGTGIPAAERKRVFEPFVRLNDEANGNGSGLGLALVQRIVAQHGGSVEVQSSPWSGCRVRLKLPREAVRNSSPQA